MLEPTPSTIDEETEEDITLSDQVRAGLEHQVIQLVTIGYNKMRDNGRCELDWKENKFTAVLKGYIDKECRSFSRKTLMQWHISREAYHDNKDVRATRPDTQTRFVWGLRTQMNALKPLSSHFPRA
jgi:hypothetical protein